MLVLEQRDPAYLWATLGCDSAAWPRAPDADRLTGLWWQRGLCCCWLGRGCCSYNMEGTDSDCSWSTPKTPGETREYNLKQSCNKEHFKNDLKEDIILPKWWLKDWLVGWGWRRLNWGYHGCLEKFQMKYHYLKNKGKTKVIISGTGRLYQLKILLKPHVGSDLTPAQWKRGCVFIPSSATAQRCRSRGWD